MPDLPIADEPVRLDAFGFPSLAEGLMEPAVDLNARLMPNRASSFLMRVSGSAMQASGAWDGDVLVVDRALAPRVGDLVVAELDGELVLRRWGPSGRLTADDPRIPEVRPAHPDLLLWGVVSWVLHRVAG